jgi:putative ATP-dependent endonuclease of OLD family
MMIPDTVRLSYEFRPIAGLEWCAASPTTTTSSSATGARPRPSGSGTRSRRRIAMDLLPALRDAEGDLAVVAALAPSALARARVRRAWRGEELAGRARRGPRGDRNSWRRSRPCRALGQALRELFASMSGPKQDIRAEPRASGRRT